MIGGPIGWPIGGVIVAEDARDAELAVTLDSASLSATGTVDLKASAAIALDGVGLSFTGALALTGQASIALNDATLAATGALAVKAAASITLDDLGYDFAGALAIRANIAVTLDDLMVALAGEFGQTITDTEVLQLPVDCVLAGQQSYKERGREYEIRPRHLTEKTWGRHSGVRALRGGRPRFTTTTSRRGYD